MHGAVFGIMIVAIVLVLLAGVTPFLIIPIVVIGLGALIAIPMLTAAQAGRGSSSGAAPSGVPSTGEASYDPVQESGRRTGS